MKHALELSREIHILVSKYSTDDEKKNVARRFEEGLAGKIIIRSNDIMVLLPIPPRGGCVTKWWSLLNVVECGR